MIAVKTSNYNRIQFNESENAGVNESKCFPSLNGNYKIIGGKS